MANPSRLQLQTETQPGKPRDPFLEQQMSQIERAVNTTNDALATASGIWAQRAIAGNYSAAFTDTALFADSSAGDLTVILPALTQGVPAGKVYAITNWQGANVVHVVQILPDLSGVQSIRDLASGDGVTVCLSSDVRIGYRIFGSH